MIIQPSKGQIVIVRARHQSEEARQQIVNGRALRRRSGSNTRRRSGGDPLLGGRVDDVGANVAVHDREIAVREIAAEKVEQFVFDERAAQKQIADLERQLAGRKKNSTNSSKPPS